MKIAHRSAGSAESGRSGLHCKVPPTRVPRQIVAVGGTFDVLHPGHERLLTRAFEIGDIVFIGVTSNLLVKKLNKKHEVRPFTARYNDVRRFVRSQGWLRRARIVKLDDPFGPAATRKRLDGLVVSEETRRSGAKLNELRRKNGLPPVRIHVVKLVKAQDGIPITSTRIRQAEIDLGGCRVGIRRNIRFR